MNAAQKDTTRITIRGNWDLGVMEKQIKEHLFYCKMWGDLNISPDEYNHIKTRIAGTLGSNPTSSEVRTLFRKYPVVMVTDIISFTLYEFDNNEFWSGWEKRYNIDIGINMRSEIGRIVREVFTEFNFEITRDDGLTNITPILCQAGIPSACFDKLFDILDSTLNSSYFISREIVSELMGYRSHLIDAPVKRYFKLHTERAVELIVHLREMMHAIGNLSLEIGEVPEMTGVQQRIVNRYAKWSSEITKIGNKSRKSTQYYFSPKLVYDQIRGICLFVPEQTLRQDSIYKLRWTIILDNDMENRKNFYSQVYNTNGRNYTLAANIPIEFASTYIIELRDDNDDSVLLTTAWTVDGSGSENDIFVFNESGFILSEKQRHISRKGTVIVFDPKRTKITETHNINKFDIDLPKNWSRLQAFCAYPTEKDARLTIKNLNEVICIECKRSFDVDLMQQGTLFDEKYGDREVPVYIRFPTVEVNGDIENYNQILFNNWQVVIIHRLSNTKHTAVLSELAFKVHGDTLYFSLDAYGQEYYSGMYGIYDLKIFDGKKQKYLTFYLSPKFEYMAHIEDIQSDRSLRYRRAFFYVQKNDSATLEFENKSEITILLASKKGTNWLEISTASKRAYINGNVIFKYNDINLKIPFRKTVRKVEWSFWDEKEFDLKDIGRTKQFYIEDLKKNEWRLALHFTDLAERYDAVTLVLESADSRQLQNKEIVVDGFGNCSVNLQLYQDTIRENLLPQRLMLYISKGNEDYVPICIAIIRSFVQLKNPKYRMNKEQAIVYWDKNDDKKLLNKKLEITSLYNSNIELITYPFVENPKKFRDHNGTVVEGIILAKPLDDGSYFIDAKEDMLFSFFDEGEQVIPIYDHSHILCVNGKRVLEKLFSSQSKNVMDWLSATITALNSLEWITDLLQKLRIKIEQDTMVFEANRCSPLLFSLLINSGEKSNLESKIKLKVKELCIVVNDFLIENTDRIEILKLLLESSISDSDCKNIINELQLYLFRPNGSVVFEKLLVQRMWDINDKMAILMNVRNCVSNNSIDIDRVLNRIGSESLKEFVKITPNAKCCSKDWSDCIELIISSKCKCDYAKFACSTRTWGDGNEYAKLFVADKRKKGQWIREIPTENHTDGYEILGKNYLTLIFELTPDIPNISTKQYIEGAQKEIYKVDNLTSKYTHLFQRTYSVIEKRLGDNAGSQRLFYSIGCASILEALSTKRIINSVDLREMLPFWRNAFGAFSELVYRDLILSEVYILFYKTERGNQKCR